MLETKEFVAENKTFVLHKFPAAQGHDLYKRMQALNGDVDKQHDFMLRVMKYVRVKPDASNPGLEYTLDSEVMINQQITSVKALLDIENEIVAWNFDFLSKGEIYICLNSMEKVADNAQNIETLTDLLGALLSQGEQPSTNLKPSTRSKKHTTSGKR